MKYSGPLVDGDQAEPENGVNRSRAEPEDDVDEELVQLTGSPV